MKSTLSPVVWGWITAALVVATVIADQPDLISFLGPTASHIVIGICGLLAAFGTHGFLNSVKPIELTGSTVAATPEAVARVAEDAEPPTPPAIQSTVLPSSANPKT